MAYIDDLKTARDNMAARLAEVTLTPKPSYTVGDQKFSWVEYQKFLIEQSEHLNRIISQNEPFEDVGQGE